MCFFQPAATKENVQPGPGTPLSPSEMVCRMTNPDSPSDARILADILADPATHLRHSRETPEGRESPFKKRPGPPSPPQQAGPVKRGLLQNAQSNSTWNDKGTGAGAVSQPAKGKSSFLSRLPLHRIDDVDLYTEHLGR